MTTNRIYAGIAAATATIALAGGAFLAAGGNDDASGATAPQPATTAQSITALARDTSNNPLSGVAVRLVDSSNATVASGTTTSTGQVSLSFTPSAGTYLVIADEPAGYLSRDDKDGGASSVTGPNCSNVYLCISLTATDMIDAAGNTSVSVELTHVRPEQVAELDDLWFEMTPPAAIVEEETSIAVGEVTPDVLIGDPSDELIGELDDDAAGSLDDSMLDDIEDVAIPAPGLQQICANVQHQPVVEQNAASGIWVRGEVYGLDGGWIWVEGPTINGGEPLQIPLTNGAFDAPLGINQFGDHELDRFELSSDDPTIDPVDLLPTLEMGPGNTFPVGPDEGSVFDTECFEFEPPVDTDSNQADPFEDTNTEDTSTEDANAQEVSIEEATTTVDAFLDGFVEAHRNTDSSSLYGTLHPSVPLAFGEDVCAEYVTRTTGSIADASTTSVGLPAVLEMNTPGGTITFPEAIPFTVDFTLVDGSTITNDAHLAFHDGEPAWLTMCGVEN
ncbi:MAG: carboxypeptidase-like regulatory domain-containing protein [Ilumatobacter sp.]